ncbi:MAG: DNA-binding protein [Desulfarculaceae bacterium]|nr:DNA-binding protein [Desulfarculaceae bacterium]MCF8073448.1 DNA-binding protein [Desulfarculaceae bacterium]MCF8100405.1 DNA-binding protein [Desulfarculaceae bacterium]MCF8115859.1 DNA-binding protein [Desulfarculaceae bacterium]
MQASEAKFGRVFILRLEDHDRLPTVIEDFARDQGITHALVALLGALGQGALVAGPQDQDARPVPVITNPVEAIHEAACLGLIAPGEDGSLTLHMHGVLGRGSDTVAGCLRPGMEVWQVAEAVVIELTGSQALRRFDAETGFGLLQAD